MRSSDDSFMEASLQETIPEMRLHHQILPHTYRCEDDNCRRPMCEEMKALMQHCRRCEHTYKTCMICNEFRVHECKHASECQSRRCSMPGCASLKRRITRHARKELLHSYRLSRMMENMTLQQVEPMQAIQAMNYNTAAIENKKKLIISRVRLLVHAKECKGPLAVQCNRESCEDMKNAIPHLVTCKTSCSMPMCELLEEIKVHWGTCGHFCCSICRNLRKYQYRHREDSSNDELLQFLKESESGILKTEEDVETNDASSSDTSSTDALAKKLDHETMAILVMHAEECVNGEDNSDCPGRTCFYIKETIKHTATCDAAGTCALPLCSTVKEIRKHLAVCKENGCNFCQLRKCTDVAKVVLEAKASRRTNMLRLLGKMFQPKSSVSDIGYRNELFRKKLLEIGCQIVPFKDNARENFLIRQRKQMEIVRLRCEERRKRNKEEILANRRKMMLFHDIASVQYSSSSNEATSNQTTFLQQLVTDAFQPEPDINPEMFAQMNLKD